MEIKQLEFIILIILSTVESILAYLLIFVNYKRYNPNKTDFTKTSKFLQVSLRKNTIISIIIIHFIITLMGIFYIKLLVIFTSILLLWETLVYKTYYALD